MKIETNRSKRRGRTGPEDSERFGRYFVVSAVPANGVRVNCKLRRRREKIIHRHISAAARPYAKKQRDEIIGDRTLHRR